MVLEELLSNFTTTDGLLLVIILILFIFLIKKFLNIIKNVVIIVIAAIVFPIVVNRFAGLSLPTDFHALLGYITIGIAAYVLYLILKTTYGVFKIGSKIVPHGGSKKGKERVKVIEKVTVIKEPARPTYSKPQVPVGKAAKKNQKDIFKNYVEIKEKPEKRERKKLDEDED